LVSKYRKYLVQERILTNSQVERMKGAELFSEILMSLHQGSIINKKNALDRAISNESINGNSLHRLSRELIATINTLRKMFPDLRTTRFRNSAEFYSLVMLVWEMRKDNLVLADKKRNKVAERILRRLSTGVDELRDRLRRVQPATRSQRLFADYLLTVQGDTDSAAKSRPTPRATPESLILPFPVQGRQAGLHTRAAAHPLELGREKSLRPLQEGTSVVGRVHRPRACAREGRFDFSPERAAGALALQ
jgi:hypothetical protein